MASEEQAPLLAGASSTEQRIDDRLAARAAHERTKAALATGGVFVFILAVVLVSVLYGDSLSSDPLYAAYDVLRRAPIIDGHIDLPILVRAYYGNNVSDLDLHGKMPGQVDIPRLKQGYVGAFFWSVYSSCEDSGSDFLNPTDAVRNTLEQIDVATNMIEAYSDTFELARSIEEVRAAIRDGKIAGLLGVEGGHQLGNSIGVLRTYAKLGVKYVTLTHTCHNAFADSVGFDRYLPPKYGGLSALGRSLIGEMNRLGVLVDLSHTADETARQALRLSKAPVIWSHSSARAVWNHPRNVPDDILKMVGEIKGKTDAVVMVNFAPTFVAAEGNATLQSVADHIEHIARIAGKRHVGLGSDFDGIPSVPSGLEDVSKYPQLIAELRKRKWTRRELAGLAGSNLLRILEKAEAVARRIRFEEHARPDYALYNKRQDLPRNKKEL